MVKLNSKKVFVFLPMVMGVLMMFTGAKVFAEEVAAPTITDKQKTTIVDHCEAIRDSLKSLQRVDSRTRVYLGRYYETILSNFIMPLNIRLVENNVSNPKLIDNQTNFAARRDRFINDFITYQQSLEELVNINCKSEPEKFYEKLTATRDKRKTVNRDVTKLRELTDEQVKLVEALKNETK